MTKKNQALLRLLEAIINTNPIKNDLWALEVDGQRVQPDVPAVVMLTVKFGLTGYAIKNLGKAGSDALETLRRVEGED